MKAEIGGYFELDLRNNGVCPQNGLNLNSGRNALRHIVRKLVNGRKIYVPYYTCHTVRDALNEEHCEVVFYELGSDFLPIRVFPKDDFVIYNNYFGVMGKNVCRMAELYENLIVDNSQALWSRCSGKAAFYSPRKFFGLPDGGIAVGRGSDKNESEYEQGHSSERMGHLLKRIDYSAKDAYLDKKKAALKGLPIQLMSKLTEALMRNFDYDVARQKRIANFNYLQLHLPSTFPFMMADDDVPMVYPYMTKDRGLRTRLIDEGIYVAKYWSNLERNVEFAEGIVPLPIDHRYGEEEMRKIVEVVSHG